MKVVTRIWLVYCSLPRPATELFREFRLWGPKSAESLGNGPQPPTASKLQRQFRCQWYFLVEECDILHVTRIFPASSLLKSIVLLDIRLTVFELRASIAVNMLIATQAINSSRNMQSKCLTQLKRQSARLIQLHTALLPHHRTAQGPEVEVVSHIHTDPEKGNVVTH
jgi:hypothetical protein